MHEEGAALGGDNALSFAPPRPEVSTFNADGRDVLGTEDEAPCGTRDPLQSRGVLKFGLTRLVSREELCGTVALADWALATPEGVGMGVGCEN